MRGTNIQNLDKTTLKLLHYWSEFKLSKYTSGLQTVQQSMVFLGSPFPNSIWYSIKNKKPWFVTYLIVNAVVHHNLTVLEIEHFYNSSSGIIIYNIWARMWRRVNTCNSKWTCLNVLLIKFSFIPELISACSGYTCVQWEEHYYFPN